MEESLGSFEQVVLLAVVRLTEAAAPAYGMSVRREVQDRTGRDVSIGAVYTTLDRLERKGYVRSSSGDPTPERRGRAKRFFNIEATGVKALNNSRAVFESLWPNLEPSPKPI